MGAPKLTRRRLLKIGLLGGGAAALATGGTYLYAANIETGRLTVTRRDVALPHLPRAFDGYRLVQVTDLHADDWMTPERLAGLVDLINAQAPDAVALTGDFLWLSPQHYADGLGGVLRGLTPRDVAVATLGNHDHWVGPEHTRGALARAGIHDLGDDLYEVRRGAATLSLAGLDSMWQGYRDGNVWSDQPRVEALAARVPDGRACVLLAHEPDIADVTAATGRFGLQLSGHSHGGQVCLPGYGPVRLPAFGKKYPRGAYQVGAMTLYTSSGAGVIIPRLRLNCPPEVAVLTLRCPA